MFSEMGVSSIQLFILKKKKRKENFAFSNYHHYLKLYVFCFLFFFCLFAFPRAVPAAYGGSQARGRIGAVANSLHHSHSNAGSRPRLQPIPQLMAMPDP